jgi:hypothetical protein
MANKCVLVVVITHERNNDCQSFLVKAVFVCKATLVCLEYLHPCHHFMSFLIRFGICTEFVWTFLLILKVLVIFFTSFKRRIKFWCVTYIWIRPYITYAFYRVLLNERRNDDKILVPMCFCELFFPRWFDFKVGIIFSLTTRVIFGVYLEFVWIFFHKSLSHILCCSSGTVVLIVAIRLSVVPLEHT